MKNLTASETEVAQYGEFASYLPQDQFLRRTALLMVCEPNRTFTSGEIADFVGCSRQHVDAIEKSAFRKLRVALAAKDRELVAEAFPKFPLPKS